MVLGDFLRDLFFGKKTSVEDSCEFGITGLPRNIEDDLANHIENFIKQGKENDENWQRDWEGTFPNFSICIGPESCDHNDDEFFQMEQNMMHQLEDMMKGLFRGFGGQDFMPDFPQLQGPNFENNGENGDNRQESLRDKMLKDKKRDSFGNMGEFQIIPFSHGNDYGDEFHDGRHSMMDWSWTFPFGGLSQREDLKDKDFDSEVESGKSRLDDIIENESRDRFAETPEKSKNGNFSFHKFSSITTKKRSDGIIESQKTVRDSEGNEEVTVIRKIGEQEHKKTTKKDSGGNEETNENLVNMDEGDLEKFEDAWIRSRTQGQGLQYPDWNSQPDVNVIPGRVREGVMDFFFPWKRS